MVARDEHARPERTAPADKFYNASEASRYTQNARMAQIQTHLAQRAVHLLGLPEKRGGALILDLGCGTGYSGRVVERGGNFWIGLDVSADMLAASRKPGKPCDQLCHDMGEGLPFRRRLYDGAISISAVQWLCVATQSAHRPKERLQNFFRGLRRCLVPGARAVLQLYPEDPAQLELIRSAAIDAEFGGALVADFPMSENSKKYFLVLTSPSLTAEQQAAGAARAAGKQANGLGKVRGRGRGAGHGGSRGGGGGRGRRGGAPLGDGRGRGSGSSRERGGGRDAGMPRGGRVQKAGKTFAAPAERAGGGSRGRGFPPRRGGGGSLGRGRGG